MRLLPALFFVLSLAAPAIAQERHGQQQSRQQESKPQPPQIDVDRLPLNLNRIQRQLRHAVVLEERDGLNLRYVIQIYGSAPPLQIFNEESNLRYGPVPYGAPTHRELINQVTPQEFQAPYADFSALFRWLSERNKEKAKK